MRVAQTGDSADKLGPLRCCEGSCCGYRVMGGGVKRFEQPEELTSGVAEADGLQHPSLTGQLLAGLSSRPVELGVRLLHVSSSTSQRCSTRPTVRCPRPTSTGNSGLMLLPIVPRTHAHTHAHVAYLNQPLDHASRPPFVSSSAHPPPAPPEPACSDDADLHVWPYGQTAFVMPEIPTLEAGSVPLSELDVSAAGLDASPLAGDAAADSAAPATAAHEPREERIEPVEPSQSAPSAEVGPLAAPRRAAESATIATRARPRLESPGPSPGSDSGSGSGSGSGPAPHAPLDGYEATRAERRRYAEVPRYSRVPPSLVYASRESPAVIRCVAGPAITLRVVCVTPGTGDRATAPTKGTQISGYPTTRPWLPRAETSRRLGRSVRTRASCSSAQLLEHLQLGAHRTGKQRLPRKADATGRDE
ncbi:unnamed protein product, partial [Protopolystoma xenopodis]